MIEYNIQYIVYAVSLLTHDWVYDIKYFLRNMHENKTLWEFWMDLFLSFSSFQCFSLRSQILSISQPNHIHFNLKLCG